MRKIIFRGKRKDNGEWVYGYLVNCIPNIKIDTNKLYIVNESFEWYEVITETVGQFTGFTDKNGKEIYEGDICKVDISRYDSRIKNKNFTTTDVRWYDSGLVLFGVTQSLWESDRIEVIGNIHDNPDLLTSK